MDICSLVQGMLRGRMIVIMKLKNGIILSTRCVDDERPHIIVLMIMGARRYRTMETAATRLQKEARGYLDSLRGVSLCKEQKGQSANAGRGHHSYDGFADAYCGNNRRFLR